MDFLPSSTTTTKCHFPPHIRLPILQRHCLPYKDSPGQDTATHTVRLRRAARRPPRRRARQPREIPRPKSGRARISYHIPVLRTVGDMRKWYQWVAKWAVAGLNLPYADRQIPGRLDVVQQPLRARMCGFGDKVRRDFIWVFGAKSTSAELSTDT